MTLDQLRIGLVLHMAGGLSSHVAHSRAFAEQRAGVTVIVADPSLRLGHHQPGCSSSASRSTRNTAAVQGTASQSNFHLPHQAGGSMWPIVGTPDLGADRWCEAGLWVPRPPHLPVPTQKLTMDRTGGTVTPHFFLPGSYSDFLKSLLGK